MGRVCPEMPCSFFLDDPDAKGPSEPAGIIIWRRYTGQQKMTLKVDEEFRIVLDGAGGDGYRWCLDSYDRRAVAFVSERSFLIEPAVAGGAERASPMRSVWHFRAIRAGEARISFWYYRVHEGRAHSVRHYLLTLDITK